MKLMQTSVALLMIFFINVQCQKGLINFDFSGTSPIDIIKLALKVLNFVVDVANPNQSPENIVTILGTVNDISNQLDSFDVHMDLKLDTMLDTLFAAIKVAPGLEYSKVKLCEYINKIDHYFDDSGELKYGGEFGNNTLEEFGNTALWCGNNLPDVLNNLLDLFISNMNKPGFLTLMHQRNSIRYTRDCFKDQSAQQQMYFIFIQLIVAEIKGLITLGRIFMLQRLLDETHHSYKPELELVKTNFVKRMDKYHEIFARDLSYFPRDLRPCEVPSPKRDDDFFELENFSRIFFFEKTFSNQKDCWHCNISGLISTMNLKYTIHDCVEIAASLQFCEADVKTSHRELMWWKDDNDVQYGIDVHCDSLEKLHKRYFFYDTSTGCHECVCSKFQKQIPTTDEITTWRVSITDQISDRWNNKIVTGLRFIKRDNAIHIQIQQGQVSNFGLAHDKPEWKELDHQYEKDGRRKSGNFDYVPLDYNRRTLHLDEIRAPDNYAITGIRWQERNGNSFELEVQATPYNFATGKLSPNESEWLIAENYPVKSVEYDGPRQEIVMIEPHDPSRGSGFKYVSKSNKKIKLRHTDNKKDAGQMTIPLFDVHSVETSPPFPLGGVGVSFREKRGFGGYIAPCIYTINVQDYMGSFNFSAMIDQKNDVNHDGVN